MRLTTKGLRARSRVLDLMRMQLSSALSGMSPDDRAKLADLLAQLVTGLRADRTTEGA
jgi:DNA-binding MarR family transcriptional regulator